MWRVYCCPPLTSSTSGDLSFGIDIGHLLTSESSKSAAALHQRRRHPVSTGAAAQPVSHHDDVDTFSEHEKHLLTSTWMQLSGSDSDDTKTAERGVTIFLSIFEQRPAAKQLFPFSKLSGGALLDNALFKSHARRFMQAVDCTIQNIDNLDLALIPILHDLGKHHAVHVAGFELEYLPVFMNAVLGVVRAGLTETDVNCWSHDVSDAWHHLMAFIAQQIAVGVAEASAKVATAATAEADAVAGEQESPGHGGSEDAICNI